jgi:hypothetical protein
VNTYKNDIPAGACFYNGLEKIVLEFTSRGCILKADRQDAINTLPILNMLKGDLSNV